MPIYPPPKVLILESRMIIAADVSLQLSKLGYDVIGINTRKENALKTIARHRPDIILMNLATRSMTGGLNTARAITETFRVPIVFLSAHTDRDIFAEVIATGPYAFIAKPFKPIDLKRGIETALYRIAAERQQRPNGKALRGPD